MANDKAPSCDGFPCEFYKTFWDEIGPDPHKVYIEAYNSYSLGNIINKRNIKFIPKASDPKDICNWRPITLIIAKALSLSKSNIFSLRLFALHE